MGPDARRKLAQDVKGFREYIRRRYRYDAVFRQTMLAQLRESVRVQTRAVGRREAD